MMDASRILQPGCRRLHKFPNRNLLIMNKLRHNLTTNGLGRVSCFLFLKFAAVWSDPGERE